MAFSSTVSRTGERRYRLCYDRPLLEETLRASDKKHVIEVFIAKDAQSYIGPDDVAALVDLVSKLSGIGKRPITQRLKQERDRRNREKQATIEAKRPSSARPVHRAPAYDAEFTPTMQLLDDVLGRVVADQPPMRALSGRLVEIRKTTPLGLHTLTSKGADAERQDGEEAIPAPPEPLIHELTNNEATLLIEKHIEFLQGGRVRRNQNSPPRLAFCFNIQGFAFFKAAGRRGCVVPPHSSRRSPALLLRALVLIETRAFSTKSSRPFFSVFRIRPTITDQDAIDAYNFLANEWLVDVTTNADGKAVAIAAALTMIQRIALDQRPAFFIVAGQRGGGKTTLASMITTAAMGRPPSAAAWASNEDERRKALLSHLRVGAASIVWDNIPRGTSIKCPHVERALTSAEYTDRVLGVSEQLTVPSLTVMLFTGNNIAPAGDMASRSLVCSIDVTRPDPENRSFTHPDPIAWTMANRSRLMRAFYTLLLWNPYLRLPVAERIEPKTRFKTWWSSIGAPIEAVTHLIGAPVDFTALFAANEVEDEEADGVAVICDAVDKKFGEQVFAVKEFCALLDAGPPPARIWKLG